MPVFKNGDPNQGRYVIAPDGRLVYHEASQKTKAGWREAEQADIDAAPMFERIKCGHTAPTETPKPARPDMPLPEVTVSATAVHE